MGYLARSLTQNTGWLLKKFWCNLHRFHTRKNKKWKDIKKNPKNNDIQIWWGNSFTDAALPEKQIINFCGLLDLLYECFTFYNEIDRCSSISYSSLILSWINCNIKLFIPSIQINKKHTKFNQPIEILRKGQTLYTLLYHIV